FQIDMSFPPRVHDASDLCQRLVFQVSIVIRRFDCDLVRSIARGHLKHSNASKIDLGKNPKRRELVWYNARQPSDTIGLITIGTNCEDLRRSLIFSPSAKRTTSASFGCLIFASWLGRLWSLRSR